MDLLLLDRIYCQYTEIRGDNVLVCKQITNFPWQSQGEVKPNNKNLTSHTHVYDQVQVGKKTIVTTTRAKESPQTGGGTVLTDGVEGTDGVDGVESTDGIEGTDGGDVNQVWLNAQ